MNFVLFPDETGSRRYYDLSPLVGLRTGFTKDSAETWDVRLGHRSFISSMKVLSSVGSEIHPSCSLLFVPI
jgi:hypothetical protein